MIVDTSALVAILLDEPDRSTYTRALADAGPVSMSAATFLETAIVIEAKLGARGGDHLDQLVDRAGIAIVPFDQAQAAMARRAWRTYGKGRHPAGLNFGDCFAYALATARSEVLLFKGNDFAQTDVTPAV